MFLVRTFLSHLFHHNTAIVKLIACILLPVCCSASTTASLAASPTASPTPPAIVVTIKPMYGLTAALTKGIAKPTLLCEGRGSTHTLSLTPRDIKTLNGADLVVWVGESYEMAMAKPLTKIIKPAKLVTLEEVKGLTLLPQRTGGLFPGHGCQCCGEAHEHNHDHDGDHHDHHEDAEDAHEHSSIDGHFWLDIDNTKLCANAIAAALIKKWPEHTEIVSVNLAKLKSDLDTLKIELKAQLAAAHGKTALIDHDSLQYVEKQFGFTVKGVLSEEHGAPPSAKHLGKLKDELDANLEEGLIKVFFYEGVNGSKPPAPLQNLADAYGIRLAPMDYVGEQLPEDTIVYDIYQACLRAIATQIKVGFE